MNDMMTMLLAQAQGETAPSGPEMTQGQEQTQTQADGANGAGKEPGPSPRQSDYSWVVLLGGMALIFYFFVIRPNKKRQQEQQQMLSSLQKGVRVRTIGGILATVVDVRGEEVVLKVDEATNAKIRVARSAIGQVLGEQSESESK